MKYEVSLLCLQQAALIPVLRSSSPCAGQGVGIELHLFTLTVGGGDRSGVLCSDGNKKHLTAVSASLSIYLS